MPQEIKVSTTDSIPGERRTATESRVAWSESVTTVRHAYDSLIKWARDNNYDAIVGFRLVTEPYGEGSGLTDMQYTAYGTCIAY